MADYNRTIWKDHIKDQNGVVIQQGIPVSAKNLNNIENQLVVLSAKENTLAELVREEIPSGFTSLSDLDYTYMATNPNTIRLLSDSIAFVNGYKVVIPAGTVIQLDAPPTSGSREDLVFLECWKQSDANGSITWNYRIRVVDGVDFVTHPEGLRKNGELFVNCVNVQGALSSPSAIAFTQSVNQSDSTMYYKNYDCGLYIPNNWTPNGASSDSYVYAIPMFRIHRRNSGGYSANNGNGAYLYASGLNYAVLPNWNQAATSNTVQVSAAFIANVNVGDILKMSGASLPINTNYLYTYLLVTAKDTVNNKLTLLTLCGSIGGIQSGFLMANPRRHDMLFADIVADRDITDLRHKVSLTGFNYQQLLEENFDKLSRGELQTNAKNTMIKTYHGIPKTPIDTNTVFYASMDGTTTAEVGGSATVVSGKYKPSPTGLGFNGTSASYSTAITISGMLEVDFFVYNDGNMPTVQQDNIVIGLNGDIIHIGVWYNTGGQTGLIRVYNSTGTMSYLPYMTIASSGWNHIRLVISPTAVKYYLNGKLVQNNGVMVASSSNFSNITSVTLFGPLNYAIADVSISNIDRGSMFSTLPQDFIDGYARISTAFNEQRNVFSDALTSEIDFIQVKCAGGNGKAIALGDATDWAKDDGTKWNTGDRVKVKGLAGEIISGVIDSDTALATLVRPSIGSGTTGIQLYVDSVAKFSVSDTFKITDYTNYTSAKICTITAIDSVNNMLTVSVDSVVTEGMWLSGFYCIETTASTSSPKVQYFNGSALVDVTGTWSGLGTNEATFALGTNSSLTSQDLYVTYGLNEIPGQGGIPEVLTAALAGESNGKRLIVNPSAHIRDDFAGKVSGSIVVSPNISKTNTSNISLLAPNLITDECTDDQYSTIKNLDGNCSRISTIGNQQISQQLFSFNLIRILEDKFGPLPCGSDTASKVAWLYANVKSISFNWYGKGSGPNGNKVYVKWYQSSSWITGDVSHTLDSVSKLILIISPIANNEIKSDGFIHFIAHADASDGITPSTIYTDYVNIEIVLNSGVGYDVLAPENPRRDDGKSNILLVRKETKEIQTMFPRGNNDKIVTYGEYVPYQGLGYTPIPFSPIVSRLSQAYFTGLGTGANQISSNYVTKYRNMLNRVQKLFDTSNLSYSNIDIRLVPIKYIASNWYLYSTADNSVWEIGLNYSSAQQYHQGLQIKADNSDLELKGGLYVYAVLIVYNNTPYLIVLTSSNGRFDNINGAGTAYIEVFKVKNNPLIK